MAKFDFFEFRLFRVTYPKPKQQKNKLLIILLLSFSYMHKIEKKIKVKKKIFGFCINCITNYHIQCVRSILPRRFCIIWITKRAPILDFFCATEHSTIELRVGQKKIQKFPKMKIFFKCAKNCTRIHF